MIIKPIYYDEFKCIADQCQLTCCRDWKIAVDLATKEKWKTTPVPEAMQGEAAHLSDYVVSGWGGDQIKLLDNGSCPFLNEKKLCHIVAAYGEECISNTCHTFPREEHEFGDRKEYSLTMGCPAALELLWKRDEFYLDEQGDSKKNKALENADESILFLRSEFCKLIQKQEIRISNALLMIFYVILDIYEKEEDISHSNIEAIFQEPFLKQLENAISEVDCDPYDKYMEQNELFLDLAENYRNKKIYMDVIEPLAELAEKLEGEKQKAFFLEKRQKFEIEWNRFEKQIRLLLAEELYSTLYLPGGNWYTCVLKVQWLGITYVAIKQSLFLRWLEKGSVDRSDMASIVTVLIRMTGYSEDDIEEYLENSFEEIIWDWGYMALII